MSKLHWDGHSAVESKGQVPPKRRSLRDRLTGEKSSRATVSAAAWQAYRKTQVALYPTRHRLMSVIGVVAISLFLLVDLTYPWPSYVDLTPRQFFGIRMLWVACYLAMLAGSFYKEVDERWQRVRDYTLVTLTAGFLGVVSAHTGRMGSPYYGGIMLMLLSRCVLLPGVITTTAIVCVHMIVVWALVACLWPARIPAPGFAGELGAQAISNVVFIVSAFGISLFGAYLADRLALGLETAKLMGRYRLGRRIGHGGMGDVYLAYHASLRRPCAVKILKEEISDAHAIARFEREAEAASRLRHPNTIAVFDFGRTENGQPYYVMEYLEGCDLRELVNTDGPLSPERAVHLLSQAAQSLAEAHGLQMVHRDIKPGNLFVTSTFGEGDFIKVLDFGLVKGIDLGPELTRPNAFMGTPRYMAPEALSGSEADARVDVYALGAVAYFMLTGQPPFYSSDPYADVHRQLTEPPPPLTDKRDPSLPQASDELQEVLFKSLSRDPKMRYGNAAELAAALQKTPEYLRWHPQAASTRSPTPLAGEKSPAGAKGNKAPGPATVTEDEQAPTLPAGSRILFR